VAQIPQVSGPAEILINTGAAGALASLGWTAEGVDITAEALRLDVPGDQNGGSDGVPIEIQDFGATFRVRMELTKWEKTVGDRLKALFNAVTGSGGYSTTALGAVNTPGALMVSNAAYFRLLIKPTDTAEAVNFKCAILRDSPWEINLSSKYSRFVITATCYPLNGIIWDRSIT
jgi:hypothetical protein